MWKSIFWAVKLFEGLLLIGLAAPLLYFLSVALFSFIFNAKTEWTILAIHDKNAPLVFVLWLIISAILFAVVFSSLEDFFIPYVKEKIHKQTRIEPPASLEVIRVEPTIRVMTLAEMAALTNEQGKCDGPRDSRFDII